MHFKTCNECNSIIHLGEEECPHCHEPQSKIEYVLIPIGIILVLALFVYSASFISFEERPKEKRYNTLVDIRKVIKKEPYMVNAYLGEPQLCEQESEHKKHCYYNKNMEILYLDERADWIKINKINNISYGKEALALLDLSISKPTLQNNYVMTWTKAIRGIHEVSIFGAKGMVSAIHVKATQYKR